MKLSDALHGLPERSLRPYRTLADLPPTSDIPAAQLAKLLATPARVRARIAQLDRPAMTALRILWFQGSGPNSWARSATFRRLEPNASLEQSLKALEEHGILLPTLSVGGPAIPDELLPTIAEICDTQWLGESNSVVPAEEIPAPPQLVDPAVAVADFIRFLATLRAGVRIRGADSVPYLADQRLLAAAMDRANRQEFPPFHGQGTPWGGYARELGMAFAAALTYGLLDGRGGRWYAGERAAAWAALPPLAQWAGLLQAWILAVLPDQHPPSRMVSAVLPVGIWCRPRRRWRFITRYQAVDPDRLTDTTQNLVLALGIELGALEYGPLADAEEWMVRLRPEAVRALQWLEGATAERPPFPEFAETPLAQGTFEVLAGPRVAPQAVWVLESWAERSRLDRYATYRLTQGSVTSAARRGEQLSELLAVLENSPGGVPQNVAFSLREWTGGVVRAQAEVGVVLRVDDDDAAERVAGVLARQERLGPRAWLVTSEALAQVWRSLTAAGCEIAGDLDHLRLQLRPVDRPTTTTPGLPWPAYGRRELPRA